jgi:hypothetical protein
MMQKQYFILVLVISLIALPTVACTYSFTTLRFVPVSQPTSAAPQVLPVTNSPPPRVILLRLHVEYLGADGHRFIGSSCPGSDNSGSVDDYHFIVHGVDIDRGVEKIVIAGDNSTLTWAWPCNDSWGLLAKDLGEGTWEIFIAPSSFAATYTVLFFYDDNTIALGMVSTFQTPASPSTP